MLLVMPINIQAALRIRISRFPKQHLLNSLKIYTVLSQVRVAHNINEKIS